MSSSYWLNRVGTAATVTTPTGYVPEYGLAVDVGTASWPDAQTFNTWAQDAVQTERADELAAMEAESQEADQGWFQENIMGGITQLIGSDRAWLNAIPIVGTYIGYGSDPETTTEEERLQRGSQRMESFANAPGIKQINQAYEATTRPLETAFLMYRNSEMKRELGPWFDRSAWGAAWREAEDRNLGEAVADAVFTEYGDTTADLDRRRRTNSLYGLTSFSTELYAGFKLDPTVLGGKALGEVGRIKRGELPRGYTSQKTQAEARNAARAENPETYTPDSLDPRAHYGAWRGRQVAGRFDDVRRAAREMDFAEFSDLPMFKKRSVNGPQAALAMQIAAKDDALWDLTRRAVLADPKAWAQINEIKDGLTAEFNTLTGSDAANYVDAIDAMKTKMATLDNEIGDLQKTIARREATGPVSPRKGRPGRGINEGFFDYHTWELHRDLEGKLADLEDVEASLRSQDDYIDWLNLIRDEDGVWAPVDQASNKPNMKVRSSYTYQPSLFGKVHRVSEVSKGAWLKSATPIDLHRVDSGVLSIRRQFEQFRYYFGYDNPEAVAYELERFTKAKDKLERWKIAQSIEDNHLIPAVAQRHGLEAETVDAFMRETRLRRNEMAEALLSGDGAVYSTVPGPLDQEGVRLLKVKDGLAEVEVMENGTRHTMRIPEDALRAQNLPADVTQTPNYYQPMDTRQVHLAVKRNAELFRELDSNLKNFGRDAAGRTMETINKGGTFFNALWKPAQLFRLAWPQRVLMDEGFRSLAVLGVNEWARTFGPAFTAAAVNAVNPALHGIGPRFRRRNIKIGPGPLADELTGKAFDVPLHDAAVEAAPFVPAYLAPKVNPKRRTALTDMVAQNNEMRAVRIRVAAHKREGKPYTPPTNRLGYGNPINHRLGEFARRVDRPMGDEPMVGSIRETFDPITGKRVNSGYAVPVAAGKRLRAQPGELGDGSGSIGNIHRNHDLNDYIEKHADLLASGGYRITFQNVDGHIEAQVVRVFRTNEKAKAIEMARHVEADEFFDLGKGQQNYIRDWNDKSPIMEALERRFVSEAKRKLTPGDSPAEGIGPVYHGTDRDLPDDLLTRQDAPIDHGQMVGEGFYTTLSREVAQSYGKNPYTIRGSKSGKRYKVWDLDRPINQADRDELVDFIARYYEDLRDTEGLYLEGMNLSDVDWILHNNDTWFDLFYQLDGKYIVHPTRGKTPQQLLTDFLEQQKGAGALTHEGGRIMGGMGDHQVYVWLHPEDLKVRPAYEPSGKYRLLEEWVADPRSQENLLNPVPESRIVRTGDKRWGRLNDIRRRLEARRLKPDYEADPVYQALLGQERKLVEQLEKPNEPLALPGAPAADDVVEGDLGFLRSLDNVHERFLRRLENKRRQYGHGHSKWKSKDGKQVEVQNFLEGEGEVYVPLISSQPTFARLTDTYKRTLSQYRKRAIGYKRIQPPKVTPEALKTRAGREAALEYYGEWSNLLNDQIRNSPVIYRMLRGESDDEIIRWLTRSEEGAKIRRQVPHKGRNPERWVEELRQRLDFYLPDPELQALLRDRKINPTDLRRVPERNMPEIYGPDMEMVLGDKGWGSWFSKQVEKVYYALGTVPVDQLTRQPLARAMYDLRMKNLIASTDSEWLTPDLLKAYEKQSREFAIRQIRRTLFDLTDEDNFTQAVRFMAPFWGAQKEAMVKWFGIAVENPETVARFYVGLQDVYEQFFVINEDGERVTDTNAQYNPNDRVVMQIPERLKKLPFFDKALKDFGSVGASFGSMNTALQGDMPIVPSFGPIVTVPAQRMADAMWDTHGAEMDDNFFYRWLFPVGRPSEGVAGDLEQLFPGWGRKALAVQQGQESRSYMNTWFTIQREMTLDHAERGLPPPSPEEVERSAMWHFALRTLGAFALPASVEIRPEHQFFLDEYHKMLRTYGPGQAFEKFVEKYGRDTARYAASSSNGFVPPTRKGMEDWSANKSLMQDIIGMGPEFEDVASLVISPEAWTDEFSSDSYREQFSIPLGPGSAKKLRESQDPMERINNTDRRVGWVEYRQFMSSVNAELYRRGLTSLEQRGAEDLKGMKQAWVAEQEAKNPAWSTDYRQYGDTIYQRINAMKTIASQPQFDSRPDIQGLRQYLMIRDAAAGSLDQWAAQGGSRSLQAQENTQLRNWFYGQVGQLIQANPAFGELYVRFLESDRLERGSGP